VCFEFCSPLWWFLLQPEADGGQAREHGKYDRERQHPEYEGHH
jgi:hypothetical protein